MSKKSNVNPDAYETGGRDRPGEDILHEQNKQAFTQSKAASAQHGEENFIPGAAPVGEKKSEQAASDAEGSGQGNESASASSNA